MPRSKRERTWPLSRRAMFVSGTALLVLGLWLGVSEPWGLDVWELLPFVAPGALLGLGAGWLAHTPVRARWTWSAARNSAIVGAVALPPLIALSFALVGPSPERVLTGTVRAAWLALAGGAIWALGTWGLSRVEQRRR